MLHGGKCFASWWIARDGAFFCCFFFGFSGLLFHRYQHRWYANKSQQKINPPFSIWPSDAAGYGLLSFEWGNMRACVALFCDVPVENGNHRQGWFLCRWAQHLTSFNEPDLWAELWLTDWKIVYCNIDMMQRIAHSWAQLSDPCFNELLTIDRTICALSGAPFRLDYNPWVFWIWFFVRTRNETKQTNHKASLKHHPMKNNLISKLG